MNDETRWKIDGIKAELAKTDERRGYLQGLITKLSGNGDPLGPVKGKGATASKPKTKRKRVISEETRQKMRDGARKRWEARNQPQTATAAEQIPPLVV